jgi:hypothetical protein
VLNSFYRAARRDAAFRAEWDEAAGLTGGELRIVAGNRRSLQQRRMRRVKFDARRQQAFLAHFAWSCDAIAAAEEAGVCERTVYNHRQRNPGFAELFEEALDQGYARLEAEALRARLAMQAAMRAAIDGGGVPPEAAAEFERILKLLARRDRKPRRPEREAGAGSGRRGWTFDAAMALLDRRLKALGIAVPLLPTDAAARYDALPPGDSAEGTA